MVGKLQYLPHPRPMRKFIPYKKPPGALDGLFMSVLVLDDAHFASVVYTLRKTDVAPDGRESTGYDLGFHLGCEGDRLSEAILVDMVGQWRSLNYKAYDETYGEEPTEPEPLVVSGGKRLSPIGLIKALHSIRYQVIDFAERMIESEQVGGEAVKPYNNLLTCIGVIANQIIQGLPAYNDAEWSI